VEGTANRSGHHPENKVKFPAELNDIYMEEEAIPSPSVETTKPESLFSGFLLGIYPLKIFTEIIPHKS
jgi:hypothetical protein